MALVQHSSTVPLLHEIQHILVFLSSFYNKCCFWFGIQSRDGWNLVDNLYLDFSDPAFLGLYKHSVIGFLNCTAMIASPLQVV